MKLKHTQARKARTFNPRFYQKGGIYSMSNFWRRVYCYYGADARTDDLAHPNLEQAVSGMRSRLNQGKASRFQRHRDPSPYADDQL